LIDEMAYVEMMNHGDSYRWYASERWEQRVGWEEERRRRRSGKALVELGRSSWLPC
jgi:hypothetical protein